MSASEIIIGVMFMLWTIVGALQWSINRHQIAYAASETAALLKQIGSSENKASKFQDRALAAEAGNERLQAQLLEAQGQIPHEGDGSCDHCGKIPSIAIPTSLCNECRDGVKRAETAEAQLAHMRQLLLQTMADEGSYDLADWKADVEEALLSTTSSAKWLEKHNAEKDAQLAQMREALTLHTTPHVDNCGCHRCKLLSSTASSAEWLKKHDREVAKKERERCAKECDDERERWASEKAKSACSDCAAAIRNPEDL